MSRKFNSSAHIMFAATVKRWSMWKPNDTVHLAVSGGMDSMVMLHMACRTRYLHKGNIKVITIDHKQHVNSLAYSNIVMSECEKLGVPCKVVSVNLDKNTSEDEARDARYSVFRDLEGRVALAHHSRDQAETILINLIRGTGPKGLGGMRYVRGMYVRPMLDMNYNMITEYARINSIPIMEDPSNFSMKYLRNRVRHEMLPLMDDIREGSVMSISRSANIANEDNNLLNSMAMDIPFKSSCINAAPIPLARRRVCMAIGSSITSHITNVLDAIREGKGTIQLSDYKKVTVKGDDIFITTTT